jgi:hypothetical protein
LFQHGTFEIHARRLFLSSSLASAYAALMQTATAFEPSPTRDSGNASFAAFLARLAELPDWDADTPDQSASPEPADAHEEEIALLSYEHVLRGKSPASPTAEAARSGLESSLAHSSISSLAKISEPRRCRATLRLTSAEDEILRKRAAESGLAISAYIRSCVFEVESLRAQVKQMMAEIRAVAPMPSHSVIEPHMPTLAVIPAVPALAAPPEPSLTPRPLQPLIARAPQTAAARRLDPRIQAAFDAQKQLSAELAQKRPQKTRSGLLGFLFRARGTR